MYSRHPSAKEPEDPALRLWRYMDFTKFVSLLESRSLFFARLSVLDDRFEGRLARPAFEEMTRIPDDLDEAARTERLERARRTISFLRQARDLLFVSSWHANDYESAAMWRLYLKSDEGVAITSTFERLCRSMSDDPERIITVGMVNYIDYDRESFDPSNVFNWVFHKRRSFAHEQEIRGVLLGPLPGASGVMVRTDFHELIEAVHVAPGSPGWFRDLVAAVSARYGLEREVRDSALEQQPLY